VPGRDIEPHVFVILGATGDLAQRKLLPAVYRLFRARGLDKRWKIVGVARDKQLDDESYRGCAGEALKTAGVPADEATRWCGQHLHYHSIEAGSVEHYKELGKRIETLEMEGDPTGNRVFYLALPPVAFGDVIAGLGAAGLGNSDGWVRIVVEKPFGYDLESARRLNETAHWYFDESQLYRIDHYLGKETVQNLLFLRFSNLVVESLWNRDRIDNIQLTVAESLGLEGRAGYYDGIGALRDMVQSHLTQLLSLLGMEVPSRFEASAVRNEKLKLLQSVLPIRCEDVVFGQYGPGHISGAPVIGYCEEPGIAPTSGTETYVAMRVMIDNWRWQGVPFYLRTGKRMERRITQVVVTFKSAPVCLFESLGADCPNPNALVSTLQPEEGFALHLDVKSPAETLKVQTIPLHFQYKEAFGEIPGAYDMLLLEIMTGDQTLFVSAEETETSWRIHAPVIQSAPPVRPYPAGSWGPVKADQLLARDGRAWWRPTLAWNLEGLNSTLRGGSSARAGSAPGSQP
jgi:glucose-6-phosphate 1-dehydrogenase